MKVEVEGTKAQKNTELSSDFTGGLLADFFIGLIVVVTSLITLGFAYPAMECRRLRWRASRTYLNGRQLVFDGEAKQLFGKYVLWALLSVITFGLYYIFSAKLKLTRWKTKHTHFIYYKYDINNNQSRFDGKWYQLFAVNFISRFITIITLSVGYYWAHCYKEQWYCKHKIIDGCELQFDGTGMQYFKKRLVWTALTVITCGIYVFWLHIKSVKWTVSHTKLLNMPNEDCFMSEEEIAALPPKSVKSKAQKLCITGFCFSVIGFVISCIYYGMVFANLGGAIFQNDFSGITKLRYLLANLLLLFIIAGIVICSIGRGKISGMDTKHKRYAIAGIVLNAIMLEVLVMIIFSSFFIS